MSTGYLLGIDIGTYESKGVITNLEGEVISLQTCAHDMNIPHLVGLNMMQKKCGGMILLPYPIIYCLLRV